MPATNDEPGAVADRALGALVGLAVGDALGTTIEFSPRDSCPPVSDMVGGGPFGLAAGEWTDDTSMALCLADSLIANGGVLDELPRTGRQRRPGRRQPIRERTLEAAGHEIQQHLVVIQRLLREAPLDRRAWSRAVDRIASDRGRQSLFDQRVPQAEPAELARVEHDTLELEKYGVYHVS